MRRILTRLAVLAVAMTVPASLSAQAALEGRWKNPKGSVVVEIEPCGNAYCGTVVDASAKAKAGARKGGTASLIGTRILSDVRPNGKGAYKGRAFEPKRNIRAPAIIRVVGPSTLLVKGCVIGGLLCKEQRWTRIS